MKIGFCSDSHDHLANLENAMKVFKERGVQAIVHSGDFVAPFTIDTLKLGGCPVYGVYGNCDGERAGLKKRFEEIGEIFREPHIYNFDGLRVVVMHHPDWVEAFANPELADIVVHGHTHEARMEHRPPWVINPGEVFGRLSAGPTVMIFDTEAGKPELISLNGDLDF